MPRNSSKSRIISPLNGPRLYTLRAVASKKWFDGLAEEDQKLVMEAAQESAEYQRSLSRDAADRLTGLLEEEWGMKVDAPVGRGK